jgi:ATP-dependent DNA helicase RecQ
MEAHGLNSEGSRRVDFLFSHPGAAPLAIEIDGSEHLDNPQIDAARDAALSSMGISVVRVLNREIENGSGPNLDRIYRHCSAALSLNHTSSADDDQLATLILDCSDATKLQFALARALSFGWLQPGGTWTINVYGSCRLAAAALHDAIQLLGALDQLYQVRSTPDLIVIRAQEQEPVALTRVSANEWLDTDIPDDLGSVLSVFIERYSSPYDQISSAAHEQADIILRPTYLPLDVAARQNYSLERRAIQVTDLDSARASLRLFLQNIFRKIDFRPLQDEAVFKTLQQLDSIVLLPTGAGKSIIYQLAGLLMPGVTLVVDPIISLIEDQIEVLAQYGIDRAAPVTSALATLDERAKMLLRVERGEYQFVLHSPERLQSRSFRESLRRHHSSTWPSSTRHIVSLNGATISDPHTLI